MQLKLLNLDLIATENAILFVYSEFRRLINSLYKLLGKFSDCYVKKYKVLVRNDSLNLKILYNSGISEDKGTLFKMVSNVEEAIHCIKNFVRSSNNLFSFFSVQCYFCRLKTA